MSSLIKEIEKIREDLILLAKENSLTDPLVVRKSQELDRILNQFYRKVKAAG